MVLLAARRVLVPLGTLRVQVFWDASRPWCSSHRYNLRMTIHSEHPFTGGPRDPIRQFRGRMPAPVSIWAATAGQRWAGWTVSSFLVADGAPPIVVGLVDEDSDLATAISAGSTFTVSLLGWQHRGLADPFAGLAPAPGGLFRLGSWVETAWGPILTDSQGWLGARLLTTVGEHAGWPLLIRAEIEHAELSGEGEERLLAHARGRYVALSAP
jgi:flavin reductase (DIM6/NTAB) family NADH-FMN oxidoreductase RutF